MGGSVLACLSGQAVLRPKPCLNLCSGMSSLVQIRAAGGSVQEPCVLGA